jgi:predicted glycosyl hydrolase (DUF1957 family)
MDELTKAVQKNTVNKLQEANRLIETQKQMATILSTKINPISTASSEEDLRVWLANTVNSFAQEGHKIEDLGIAGLSMDTDFSKLDKDALSRMVGEVLEYKGRENELAEQQATNMRSGNVAAFTLNAAEFNASQVIEGKEEFRELHRDALLAQAIEAGVGEIMI